MLDHTVTLVVRTVAKVTLSTLSALMVALLAVVQLCATLVTCSVVVVEVVAVCAVETDGRVFVPVGDAIFDLVPEVADTGIILFLFYHLIFLQV